jgi:hypothetical protein
MMAFFMPFYKKYKAALTLRKIALIGLFVSIAATALANPSSLQIMSAELAPVEESYAVNAQLEMNFNAEVEDALNKGIPLTFLVEFQLYIPHRYWFDDEVVTTTNQVTLSYHALSRQYLINQGNHQQTFATILEAKEEFTHIHDWLVFEKALLKKDKNYRARLMVKLDQSKLPKPLQVEAMSSENWKMVSERFMWTPTFAL